jgi:cytochrome P450
MNAPIARVLPPLEDLEGKTFNVFFMEREMRGRFPDPYPLFEKMRQESSVHKVEFNALFSETPDVELHHLNHYTVFGYDACTRVLDDPETFTSWDAWKYNIAKSFGRTVTVMDGAEHKRFRKVLQKAFLPHVVQRWGVSVVQPVIDRLVNKFIDRGKADLIEEYTHHFPFQIIYSMLLLDPDEAPVFHKLAVAQLLSAGGFPQGAEATAKLGSFFKEMLAERRANPGDDLVSHLATIEVDGDYLDEDVLISFLRQLVNAGGDTTYRSMSVLLTCLLREPELLDRIRNDRKLVPLAVEEALRWDGPITVTYRGCVRDTEIDGVLIPAGAFVNVVLGSANRDPTKFKDPDKFDIFRERTARPLPFAGGPHICVGQHLARVELGRALEGVLDRLPNVRLDPDMPEPQIVGHALRSPDHIHVVFDKV